MANTTQEFKKRNRVQTKDIILFVGTALFFDFLQILFSFILSFAWIFFAIPVIGKILSVVAPVFGATLSIIISVFAWLTFYTWTSIKKWSVSGITKRLIVRWLIPIIEIIPYLNILPTWTIRAIMQLLAIRSEDVVYNTSKGMVDLEKTKRLQKTVQNSSLSVGRSLAETTSSTPDFKKAV